MLLVAALIVAFFLLRRYPREPAQAENLSIKPTAKSNQAAPSGPKRSIGTTLQPLADDTAHEMQQYLEAVHKDPSLEWRFPINFWGKVIDETGQPIEGATISFQWNDLSAKGTSEKEMKSDGNGLFALTGQTGKGLSVHVEKRGYYQPSDEYISSFEYADPSKRFHPDAARPVVFVLTKADKWEPLIHRGGLVRLQDQNSRLILNLTNPSDWQKGDLAFEIWRDPNRTTRRFYDWSFTVKCPSGGVTLWETEFPGSAPESGYTPELKLEFKGDDPAWTDHTSPKFYFVFGSPPRYGRISVTRYFAYGDRMDVEYWVNPSGSRNVEADPRRSPEPLPQR